MALVWVLLAVVILCILIYKFAYAPYQVLKQQGIKHPTPIPFFGNYLQIIRREDLAVFYQDMCNQYGPLSGFYVGQYPFILTTDVELLKHVTVKEFGNFFNRLPLSKISSKIIPSGLLFARDEVWKNRRTILSPTFSGAKMKLIASLLENSANTLVEVMGENADTGKSIDVLRIFGSFTMETILATAFGRVLGIQRGEGSALTKAATDMFTQLRGHLLFMKLILSNFPWIDSLLAYFLKPSAPYSFIFSTAIQLVKARREEPHTKHKDLLQLMMDASAEEEENETGKVNGDRANGVHGAKVNGGPVHRAPKKLTNEEVAQVSMDLLLAGYETTSNTLTFLIYLLAMHPEIQEKLQEEIDSYFEDHPTVSLYEAASDIKYLDMVVQETLRMHPAAPVAGRECGRTTTINGVTISKGTTVVIPIEAIHYSTLYWQEPEKFDPLRFTAEEKAKRPQLCYMPFGNGPRTCIGMRLALLEIKIAVIEVLKEFTFVRAPDTEVPLKKTFGLTVTPTSGSLYLRVARRH